MFDISHHILDIAENSIIAGAKNISISLCEMEKENLLVLEINDDGKGIAPELLKNITSPFTTSRKERSVGMGLALLSQVCEETKGSLVISSKHDQGTIIKGTMQLNHIDRLPIGDLSSTVLMLLVSSDTINFDFEFSLYGRELKFSTSTLQNALEIKTFSNSGALARLKGFLNLEFGKLMKDHEVEVRFAAN